MKKKNTLTQDTDDYTVDVITSIIDDDKYYIISVIKTTLDKKTEHITYDKLCYEKINK